MVVLVSHPIRVNSENVVVAPDDDDDFKHVACGVRPQDQEPVRILAGVAVAQGMVERVPNRLVRHSMLAGGAVYLHSDYRITKRCVGAARDKAAGNEAVARGG